MGLATNHPQGAIDFPPEKLVMDAPAAFKILFDFHASRGWSAHDRHAQLLPLEMAVVFRESLSRLGFESVVVGGRLNYQLEDGMGMKTTCECTALGLRVGNDLVLVDLVGNLDRQSVEARILAINNIRASRWEVADPGWQETHSLQLEDLSPHDHSAANRYINAGVAHVQALMIQAKTPGVPHQSLRRF